MALFNFGKTKEGKPEVEKPKATAKPKAKPVQKKAIEKKPVQPKGEKVILGEAYKALKSPHITEKASFLAESNQYAFNVYERANKKDIKRAVEDVFGAEVVSVKIINVRQKEVRVGRTKGTKPGYKKAIVKIKEGQKIEILPR
jgi:large subunit ribosomal protein L23